MLAAAQQPKFSGTNVETISAASGLQSAVRQATAGVAGPVWVGYAVPIVDSSKPRMMCCGNYTTGDGGTNCCGSCRLETESTSVVHVSTGECMQTEPASYLIIMLRYADGKVTRTRTMTPGCGVDATGATVRWLNDVQPAQSVALLASLVGTDAEARHLQDTAIMSIALHADPAAEAALQRFLGADQPEKIREKAAFWEANERGRSGFLAIQKLAREDKDDRFRRQLAFDLTLSKEPEAVPELIRMAHQDADGGVRGQALFWMAQKAGRKLVGEIAAMAENDPDTEVKKRAVFALSQIPDGEGVPKLIEVARNNRNPAVRKQAIFWLGQSRDPRALSFIEDVLTR
jgi:hypothetical protein